MPRVGVTLVVCLVMVVCMALLRWDIAQQQFWQSASLPMALGCSGHLLFLLGLSGAQTSERLSIVFFPYSLLSQVLPRWGMI